MFKEREGTLTPFIFLSFRAIKRERERRIGAEVGLFGCGGWVCILSVLRGGRQWKVRDSVSGGGRPAWFSPVFLCYVADKRGVLARGHLYHQFFIFLDPLGGVGNTFSRCRRWVNGNLRRERRGRFFQGRNSPRVLARHMRGTFGQRSL